MKFIIELNPTEFKASIQNGTLPALVEAAIETETVVLAATGKAAQQAEKKVARQSVKEEKKETETPKIPVQESATPKEETEKIEGAPSNEETSAVTYTLEQVRAKLAAISQSGKSAEMKQLIASFGATKLTDISADKYPELMKKAEALV